MRRLLAFVATSLLLAGAAEATETLSCRTVDGSEASLEMNMSSTLPAYLPTWVRATFGDETWSTMEGDDGTPAKILQAFDDGRLLSIDLVDDAESDIVVSVRLLRGVDDEKVVFAGTLSRVGETVHAIACDVAAG